MKLMLLAATTLAMTGSALAYQTVDSDVDAALPVTANSADATTTAVVGIDPNMAIAPPHSWTVEQRALWDQHMAQLPPGWTADQRASFEAMMALPPANWTADQRALYQQHMASLPATWTPEQRLTYEEQMAKLRTPWRRALQTAAVADPSQGQANLQTFAGMGGPYEEAYGAGSVSLTPRPADQNYPPCNPGPGDDNCIQLYERGIRDQLASWNSPTGGLMDGASTTAMGGPFDGADPSETPHENEPVGTTPADPVDTQGSSIVDDSARGVDADEAAEDPVH